MRTIKEHFQRPKSLYGIVGSLLLLAMISAMVIHLAKRFDPNYFAGEIFDQRIPLERFQAVHHHLRIQNRMQYGENFAKLAPMLDLEDKTWDRLILLKAAEDRGITVTDQEVVNEIAQYPYFKRRGRFNTQLYNRILRDTLGIKPVDFEATIRESMIIDRLTQEVLAKVSVTDQEVRRAYRNQNEKIKATSCFFPYSAYEPAADIPGERIVNYYKSHTDDLRVAPSVNLKYIALDFPDKGGVQKEVETKYKAKAIVDEYADNPDLEQLAAKYDQTVEETGFFSKNELNFDSGLPLRDLHACFKLKEGVIQPPVERADGYTVYLVEAKQPAYTPRLREANDRIKQILQQQQAEKNTLKAAAQYRTKFQAAPEKMEELAGANDLKTEAMPLLAKQEYLYALSLPRGQEAKLFALTEKGQISEPMTTPQGVYVLRVDEYAPVDEGVFEKEKAAFKQMLLRQKEARAFNAFLEAQIEKAGKKENPSLDFLNTLPEKARTFIPSQAPAASASPAPLPRGSR
jgi:parvulin-like peptidyl-prolyl isomerase